MATAITVRVAPDLAAASPHLRTEEPGIPDSLQAVIQRQVAGLRRRLDSRGVEQGPVHLGLDGDAGSVRAEVRIDVGDEKLSTTAHGDEPEVAIKVAFGAMLSRIDEADARAPDAAPPGPLGVSRTLQEIEREPEITSGHPLRPRGRRMALPVLVYAVAVVAMILLVTALMWGIPWGV